MLDPKALRCSGPSHSSGLWRIASLNKVPSESVERPILVSPNRVVVEPIHSSGRIGPPGP